MSNQRLAFIDNIRIWLTVVVLLNHISITYGAPGGWYYREVEFNQLDLVPFILLVLFAAGNQAYSMGFFFLISGYFSARSLTNRDRKTFLIQRLLRLGLPVLLYVYGISPLLRLLLRNILYGIPITFENIQSTYQQISFGYDLGPMWFIMLLLIFSALLPLLNSQLNKLSNKIKPPDRVAFFIFAFLVGLVTFLIRIKYPIGTVFQPLNLQTSNVAQYIFLFLFGVVSYHAKWLSKIQFISKKFWFPYTALTIILMPVLFYLSGGISGDVTPALGGLYWQSLAVSIWEQLFCLGMISSILIIFFNYFNKQTKVTQEMSASSYATFIIHPLVLVLLTSSLKQFSLPPLQKMTIMIIPTVFLCFSTASLIRRIPGIRSII